LADAQKNIDALTALGIKVYGASSDDAEGAQGSIDEGITFPIGFGMDVEDAQKLGAWTGARKGMTILQPCEFVLKPGGEVMASLYATTQLGRINPEAILRFVEARK